MKTSVLAGALLFTSVRAWLPEDRELQAFNRSIGSLNKRLPSLPNWKIRGVNLGGWLISEPWMMSNEWTRMGCNGRCSEFDCVSALGQATADLKFNDHYSSWIDTSMIQQIHDDGLNTIRIPIGYWSLRDIVDKSEHFPQMDLSYLDAVIQKAADLGMFVVIDLHGAPGSQKVNDAFTGQCMGEQYLPGFFTQYNYDRATRWLDWMTRRIHNTPAYKAAVGIIEVVNEPQTDYNDGGRPQQELDTFTQNYYPQALAAVRKAEDALNIPQDQRLHVQFMDELWGAGDPKSNLPSDSRIVLDDHNYVGGAVSASHPNAKQGDYMYYTCFNDNRFNQYDGNTPKIVQEWSLTVDSKYENSDEFRWDNPANERFYKDWFIAQQRLYEQTNGWIFWTWRNELNNPRWDYSYLVYKNWVPTSAEGLDESRKQDVCQEWFNRSDGRD